MAGFDENQPRDEKGQWTAGDASAAIKAAASDHQKDLMRFYGVEKPLTMEKRVINNDMSASEKAEALRDLIRDLPTRDAKIDTVENQIRYQDFESAAFFDKDGNLIVFADGDKGSVGVESEEDNRRIIEEGYAMTHNHPQDKSFSNGDLYASASNGTREIRAVSASNDYILRPNYDYGGYGRAANTDQFGNMFRVTPLAEAYDKGLSDVIDEINDELDAGTISLKQADKDLQHRAMKRFAEITGSEYIVVPNKIPVDIPKERLQVFTEFDFFRDRRNPLKD